MTIQRQISCVKALAKRTCDFTTNSAPLLGNTRQKKDICGELVKPQQQLCYNPKLLKGEFLFSGRGIMQSLEKLKPFALLLLRVVLGVIFIFHGYPKLVHAQQWVQNFRHMGFPGYFAYIAGVLELFGGALLIAGLFARIAGLLLAMEMAIAVTKVHGLLTNPANVHGYEFPLALCAGSLAIAAVGAGLISIDYGLLERRASPTRKTRG
jgi:putative oxidoreductase